MRRQTSRLFSAFCTLSFASCLMMVQGCATTTDMDSLKNQITTMNMELGEQKKSVSEMKGTLSEVSKDVTALKERTEGVVKEYAVTAIRESQSTLLTQTSDLSKELQTLKGRFDENKYFMDKTIKDLNAEKELQQAKIAAFESEIKTLKARLANPEGTAAPAEKTETSNGQAKPPAEQAATEAKTATSSSNDPQRIYDDAQIDFKEKRYPEARQKFEKFTKEFPKHALAPNSYFWTGETYYAEKKFDDAILSYETFLKKYPEHEKVRGAMLKQAYAFVEMGDRKTGKVILERLIEKYPTSKEAELAEKKIAEILKSNNGSTKSRNSKKKKKKKQQSE